MHQFCCVSNINNQQRKHHHQVVAPASPGTALAKFLDMPEPGPRSIARVSNDSEVVMKINELVGNGISGILYKWVNYGKGWRPRWFVLQDGVLSYYKIHGRHKIVVNQETEKGAAIIGERSFRRISQSDSFHSMSLQRRPFGEIHLKVSSMRESRSDDRRFSIYTGTKTLHLRAETREDRMAWMEALEVVRGMCPQLSNSDHLMSEVTDVVMSTEKLRQRLLDEGVSENAVDDCEQIMKSEYYVWRNRLLLLKQQHLLLVDTLRHLESEKVDLEYTVVDESHRQAKAREASTLVGQDKSRDGSMSELEYENDWHDAAEEDMDDDDDNNFLDSRDFLSSSSFRSTESDARSSLSDSDNEVPHTTKDGNIGGIKSFKLEYPHVRRRKKLPDPVEIEKGVSLWSMIKDNIGKDLTKVCLPVYFNEPLSTLQKCFEDFEYSYLLDQAYEWGKMGNHLMRILNVAAFAVSGYASSDGRTCKPFNPLLGETYEADFPDKGLHFISEKVSHHPMIIACHCEGRGWKLWGDSNLKSKFWGRSIQLDPTGTITLEFEDGEVFQWSKVTTSIYNLILGKLYCDHYGTMRIQGNRDYSCKLKFKEQSIIDRNPHQVQGFVQDKAGKVAVTLFGKWDESMFYMDGEATRKMKESADSEPEAHLLWRRSKPARYPTRYDLTRFAITLNEMTPGLKDELPPTDSRLRPDQRFLENGEFEMANLEKLRLEQRQRQAGKMQAMGWKPRWFVKERGSDTFKYIGGYWEAREKRTWESCPDIFGHADVAKDHTFPLQPKAFEFNILQSSL